MAMYQYKYIYNYCQCFIGGITDPKKPINTPNTDVNRTILFRCQIRLFVQYTLMYPVIGSLPKHEKPKRRKSK